MENATVLASPLCSERDDDHLDTSNNAYHARNGRESKLLLGLGSKAEFTRSADGTAWASIKFGMRVESVRVEGDVFRDWLTKQYYDKTRKSPSPQPLKSAIDTFAAKAKFEGKQSEVHLRVARVDGAIWIDLGNEKGEIVRIDEKGWAVATTSPAKFYRPTGMLPLPRPVERGDFQKVRPFVNAESDQEFALLSAWLLMAFHPEGPYPILAIHGPQGSGKSTLSGSLRKIIDPNSTPTRAFTRDEKDLHIAAQHSWMLAFDNISGVTDARADQLCRMATGSGFTTRKLYADAQEVRFNASRPILLNGIGEFSPRPDLLDRFVWVKLRTLNEGGRETEAQLRSAFEAVLPEILGGLFSGLSAAFRESDRISNEGLPRMIDFAKWAIAGEEALGFPKGTMKSAFATNAAATTAFAVEGNPIVDGLQKLLLPGTERTLTATEWLTELAGAVGELVQKSSSFPKGASQLSHQLTRLDDTLKNLGFTVLKARESDYRGITIRREHNPRVPAPSGSNDADDASGQLLSVTEKEVEVKGGSTLP